MAYIFELKNRLPDGILKATLKYVLSTRIVLNKKTFGFKVKKL